MTRLPGDVRVEQLRTLVVGPTELRLWSRRWQPESGKDGNFASVWNRRNQDMAQSCTINLRIAWIMIYRIWRNYDQIISCNIIIYIYIYNYRAIMINATDCWSSQLWPFHRFSHVLTYPRVPYPMSGFFSAKGLKSFQELTEPRGGHRNLVGDQQQLPRLSIFFHAP